MMAVDLASRHARRDAAVAENIRKLEARMAANTQSVARDRRLTQTSRKAVERAARKVFGARRFLIVPRHSARRQAFLKMMLTQAVAEDPSLASKIIPVARYFSRNYAFEWSVNPVTLPGRQAARELILANGDSEFGESPLAGALAYARHHPREARVDHLSSYGELYTRALRLAQNNHFNDRCADMRERLGLKHLQPKDEDK